jgi:hypothetical protein
VKKSKGGKRMRKIGWTALRFVGCLMAGALVSLAVIPPAAASHIVEIGTWFNYSKSAYTPFNEKICTWVCYGEADQWKDLDTGKIVQTYIYIRETVTNNWLGEIWVHEACGGVNNGRAAVEANVHLLPGQSYTISDSWYPSATSPDYIHGDLRWGSFGGIVIAGDVAQFPGWIYDGYY